MKARPSVKVLFLLLIMCSPLHAAFNQGVMSGAGKLRVTQTQWFDIIYAPKNEVTAQILYEKADDVYRELAASYGIEPFLRMPVVITSTVEQFNAFQTNTPFCCIVLYDTAIIPDLAGFSQTVISTFTHELTHALTYNLKDDFYKKLGQFFGDGFAGYYLSVTRGMAEGATVSYESSAGEGRLNDSYILQMPRQAKIEGKFPSYSDVKGAADSYPANAFYYFNGAFAQYLQQTYGMDKYAQFWYRCVNAKNVTAAGAFKKAFGLKLGQAWKEFAQSYEVPPVAGANPVELGQSKDFFEPQLNNYSMQNNAGSLYENLCASSRGFYYTGGSYNWVYFVDAQAVKKGGAVKPKRLFRHDYLDYLNISKDGRFAAVGYYSTLSENIKHRAAIYDMENKTWFTLPQTNISSPCIIMNEGQYYIAYLKYEPQKYTAVIEKIILDKKITGVQTFATLEFGPEELAVDFTSLGDSKIAFIKKSGLNFSICTAALDFSNVCEYSTPVENIRLRNLSAQIADGKTERLVFSWAVKETLPRLGFLDLTQGEFVLQSQNLSGGVIYPAAIQGLDVVYTAEFFRQNRILRLAQSSHDFEKYTAVAKMQESQTAAPAPAPVPAPTVTSLPYKPFNAFDYTFKGLLLPLSIASSGVNIAPWGITYVTSLPWNAGLFIMSGGYGIKARLGIFNFEYTGGTGTSLFNYDITSTMELDGQGIRLADAGITLSSSFDFGTRSAILFSLNAQADYGRYIHFTNYQSLSAAYSNVVATGPGNYERSGFNLSAGVVHSGSVINSFDLIMGLGIYIPKLIPVMCYDNFTWNLPVKLKANLFPMSGSGFAAASVSAEALLFGYDIQCAVPGISALYINDVILTIKYNGGLDFAESADYDVNWHIIYLDKYIRQAAAGQLKYRDYATVKLTLGFTPNVGGFADTRFRYNFFLSYSFGKKANLPQKLFNLGLESKF